MLFMEFVDELGVLRRTNPRSASTSSTDREEEEILCLKQLALPLYTKMHMLMKRSLKPMVNMSKQPQEKVVSECQDNATDVPGKSSHVSVLAYFFTDDDISPNSSRLSPVEKLLQS